VLKETDSVEKIALTLINGVGPSRAKKLLAYCGSETAVFKEKKANLLKIPGIGKIHAEAILNKDIFFKAESELKFVEKNGIELLFFSDKNYPFRLKQCDDAPVLLYYKGNANLNCEKIVSIVGTRNNTEYGKQICHELIQGLKLHNVLVISGLAYGIDILAHKASIANDLPTVACVAHGLDKVYPLVHKSTAEAMLEKGGLITEYRSGTIPNKENFPARNRIIAGLSDATIVVEAAISGGALITAEIANSYNKDVFAVPGNIGNTYSSGCNHLIKTNKAALLESVKDIEYVLGWNEPVFKKVVQQQLFIDLSLEEENIVAVLRENGAQQIDILCALTKLPVSKASSLLLNLEFSGIVKALPGKIYQLN
jgi:DNA processing protein